MRLLHSSDWQIGMSFGFADEEQQGVLRAERLEAVSRLGRLARDQGAAAVLVAGDIYDLETPSERTLREPVERMRAFPDLAWHLIPGNHDPHTPKGPWERLLRAGLPDNVHLHLTPEPAPLPGGAVLLPGVLTRRHAAGDPTETMEDMASSPGALRIGLAHGAIRSFGSDGSTTHNRIATDRAARAGLAYLALGDFHGAQAVDGRTWYAGTPEVDGFSVGGAGGGEALLVEIDGPAAPPVVTRHRTGRFRWERVAAELHNATDIDVLETRLRSIAPDDPSSVLAWLAVTGALGLAERDAFETRIRQGAGSALRLLRIDESGLLAKPSPADLEAIEHAGFVREAADALVARAAAGPDAESRALAAGALQRLYVLHMRLNGGAAK